MKQLYFLLLFCISSFTLSAQIHLVKDIQEGPEDSDIRNIFAANNMLFFEADDDVHGDELWISNGTEQGTFFIHINQDTADSSPNSDPQQFTLFNGLIYFNADNGDGSLNDKELWVTDGTFEGTFMVANLESDSAGPEGSNPREFFVFDDALYFQANVNSSTELWKYDGNEVVQATSIGQDGTFATVRAPYVDEANNRVWLAAQSTNRDVELYLFDGDTARKVKDVNPNGNGYGGNGIIFNDVFLFEGDDDVNGDELWISDGTEEGTVLLKDINEGEENSNPDDFVIYRDEVYFVAEVGANGDKQLWKTNGTADGTVWVASPFENGDGDISNLFVFNDHIFFAAQNVEDNVELWVYDGSEARLVMDIATSADMELSSDPENFIVVNDQLYFTAEANADFGPQLFVTDGTMEGTNMVTSLFGDTSSFVTEVDNLVELDGKLYFSAIDTATDLGEELYVLDPINTNISYQELDDVNFYLYPNPSTGQFYIETDIEEKLDYQIFDVSGKMVQNGTIQRNQMKINLPAGSYFGLFQSESKIFSRQIMIQ